MAQYRAAYWYSPATNEEVVLTFPEHAELPEDELLEEAKAEAERTGLDMKEGWIKIGNWTH